MPMLALRPRPRFPSAMPWIPAQRPVHVRDARRGDACQPWRQKCGQRQKCAADEPRMWMRAGLLLAVWASRCASLQPQQRRATVLAQAQRPRVLHAERLLCSK